MDREMTEVKDTIVSWLKKKVDEAGAEGAVIGLSGGVDSSVVALLAREALGNNLLGVIMPCGSVGEDAEHARLLADKFGLKTEFVDLGHVFEQLRHTLPGGGEGIAAANLKPRLRMLTLYYFANMHNYVVLGTGNKTEIMVGYFTKYGDGGVDLLPIGGLFKAQVRELARLIGVPEEIITKPPSAGLWRGQTDEGEIGMSYDDLDQTLAAIESGAGDPPGLEKEKLEKVREMMRKSEHKRKMAEICEL